MNTALYKIEYNSVQENRVLAKTLAGTTRRIQVLNTSGGSSMVNKYDSTRRTQHVVESSGTGETEQITPMAM